MDEVWIFHASKSDYASGAFTTYELAASWIKENSLTGLLTSYPLDEGAFDWAMRNNVVGVRDSVLERGRKDPMWIGRYFPAARDSHHFIDGEART